MQPMSSNIQIPKSCQFCGKTFIAKTTVTKHCGNSCAKKAYKKRKREEKIQNAIEDTKESLQSLQTINIITPQNISQKEFLSISEVSELLGVSRWAIQRMVKRGQLTVKQIGRKKIMARNQIDNLFN